MINVVSLSYNGSLEFFEFGEIVKAWTRILYKNFEVKIQNNGHFSHHIPIEKGVHQGGCCSSIYFLVIAEILAIAIRHNENIDGICFKEIRNLLNQFADDMDVFSLCNEKSIRNIFSELEAFHKQSGFTVSYDKTTLYRIGSLRHSSAQMYDLDQYRWSNDDITVLGVTITHGDIMSKNYGSIIEKAKTTINAWYNRGISLMAKVQVVNALVASLFVYKMMVLPSIPVNIIRNVDNIIREFLWNGGKAKIAYKVLQNPKKEGGLNLRNKDVALKATWPKILVQEKEYSQLVYSMLNIPVLGHNIWKCRLKRADIMLMNIQNDFWRDVICSWNEYNYYHDFRIENQLIWFNSSIKVAGKVIYWEKCCKKGLLYIYQLFENQHFRSEEQLFQLYDLSVLEVNSLKVAIPLEWKRFFLNTDCKEYFPIPPHSYDYAIQCENLSRKVYQFIADDAMIIHNKFLKWKNDIGEGFTLTLTDFAASHMDIYRITNVTKFRSFQYRLLQRGVITNVHLQKWGYY